MRLSPLPIALLILALPIGAGETTSARQPGPPDAPARYRVAAALDPAARTISGHAQIEWRNPSRMPVSNLRLLTPWNSRRDGALDFTRLLVTTSAGQVDRLQTAQPIAPDDGNVNDRTVWSIPLDAPVPAGQRVEIELRWTARFPRLSEDFGATGGFFLASHWVPRLGVVTDAGWQAHQTRDGQPPMAAFGRYELDLRLPSSWRVGATGRETARQDHSDGTATIRFEADRVPDFAWVASDSFVERTERLEHPGAAAIDLRVLLQPEHAGQGDRLQTAAKATLEAYNRWFGPYPWPTLTVVDLPETDALLGRAAARGLVGAHPGLVAVNTPWVNSWATAAPDAAIVAGIGEQFWRHALGVDTADPNGVTAGLSDYVTDRVMNETFKGRFVPAHRYFRGLITWPFADAGPSRVTARSPFANGKSSAAADPAMLTFVTLERRFGWDTVRAGLAAYLARGRSGHVTPDDLVGVMSSAANRDLSWGFKQPSSTRYDYSVESVTNVSGEDNLIESTITLQRRQAGVFPLQVLTTFDDGSSVVADWDGTSATHVLRYRRSAPVATVSIDPDHTLALELNRLDNSWSARPHGGVAGAKWAGRWALWLQNVLLTYAFFV